jgi:RNA 3'-phosphate cyclase
MANWVEIDGSQGEGGGQVLRSALALSVLSGRPLHLRGIRARRSNPGLAAQHLHAVRALREVSQAGCRGDQLGSRELFFEPGPPRAGSYAVDIQTAGSVSLLLQAVFLPLSRAGEASDLLLRGGTHVPWSPPFNYLETCWLPFMGALGLRIQITLERAGFYPRGGGRVAARIEPIERIQPLQLTERGRLLSLQVVSAAAGLPGHVRQRQAARARVGVQATGVRPAVQLVDLAADSPGSVVAVSGIFEHTRVTTSALGARGKPAESVGREAAAGFRFYLDRPGALDEHMADQILLPLALAAGGSVFTTVRVTHHLLTNAQVIRSFLEREIAIEGSLGEPGRVEIR